MALKRNETYPGRFSNPTDDHPQGAFKNRSAPGAQDGSYLEQQWANDWDGFFGRLLTLAEISPNGNVDTASSSQYYDALKSLFLQRTNPFGDIKSDGTVPTALDNLGIKNASPTQAGLVRLTSSRVSGEEDIAATANAVAQNYTDMKGLFGKCGMKSRNIGVTYTNSQSFAIFVSVNAVMSDGSSFLSAVVSVDGNTANFRGAQTTNLAGQRATIAFMVPAGATYIVQQFSGTVSDVTWVEVDKK